MLGAAGAPGARSHLGRAEVKGADVLRAPREIEVHLAGTGRARQGEGGAGSQGGGVIKLENAAIDGDVARDGTAHFEGARVDGGAAAVGVGGGKRQCAAARGVTQRQGAGAGTIQPGGECHGLAVDVNVVELAAGVENLARDGAEATGVVEAVRMPGHYICAGVLERAAVEDDVARVARSRLAQWPTRSRNFGVGHLHRAAAEDVGFGVSIGAGENDGAGAGREGVSTCPAEEFGGGGATNDAAKRHGDPVGRDGFACTGSGIGGSGEGQVAGARAAKDASRGLSGDA